MERQTKSLTEIVGSLSTRYIAQFPGYLPEIAKLIARAKTQVDIVVTNPIPGYFSDPDGYLDYKQALERAAARGIRVRMLASTEPSRKRRLQQQFPTTKEDWDKWVKEEINAKKLAVFLRRHYSAKTSEEMDHTTLVKAFLEAEQQFLSGDCPQNGIQVIEVDQMFTIQVWIVDGSEAILAVQSLPTAALGHGLYTSDYRFVMSLCGLVELFTAKQSLGTGPQSGQKS